MSALEGKKMRLFYDFDHSYPFGNRDAFREDSTGKEGWFKPVPAYKKGGQ